MVFGSIVVPGVVFVEMALEATRELFGPGAAREKRLFGPAGPRSLARRGKPVTHQNIYLYIISKGGEKPPSKQAQGRIKSWMGKNSLVKWAWLIVVETCA